MKENNMNKYERLRSKTIAFRLSDAERDELDRMVSLSGMLKQDYILSRLLNKDVIIKGNPRVFKALKGELSDIHAELLRISSGKEPSGEFLETIRIVSEVLGGLAAEEQTK